MPKWLRVVVVAAALGGCVAPASEAVIDERAGDAPASIESQLLPGALDVDSMAVGPIEGRYIITLDSAWLDRELAANPLEPTLPTSGTVAPGTAVSRDPALIERHARAIAEEHGATFVHTVGIIDGFVVEGASDEVVAAFLTDERIDLVEQDTIFELAATQSNATWGLDRIDQDDLPIDRSYTFNATGAGVTAYIIDSGLRDTHRELTGRVRSGVTYVNDGRGTGDCNGHGTHVAGTVAGTQFGVAKEALVVPLRVFGCSGSGSSSGILSALDHVVRTRSGPAVVNMSLGGPGSSASDRAVLAATNAGVTVVVAAGNESQDACNVSPARAPSAITVAASTSRDVRASFSNFGRCVDLFAPGQAITSAGNSSDTATANLSGTSMASPHVAGAAALVLSVNRSAQPADVLATLLNGAPTGRIGDVRGSPNVLLSVRRISGGGTPNPNPDPEPNPNPDPGTDCNGCERFTGSLNQGQRQVQPGGTYFEAPAGAHRAILRGPAGADFDLRLYQWNGSAWSEVASSLSPGNNERIDYQGGRGFFLYQVHAFSGSGNYELLIGSP